MTSSPVALSIVVPVTTPRLDLRSVIREVRREADTFGVVYHVVVAAFSPGSDWARDVAAVGARLVVAPGEGFGQVLRAALHAPRGEYVMTVDPACGGVAAAVGAMWRSRSEAEFVIGSRYAEGAASRMSPARRLGSRLLNTVFAGGLHLPVADPSSLFRIARREHWQQLSIAADDYDILPEIIVRAFAGGWRLREVPLGIQVLRRPRTTGAHVRLARAYWRMYWRLWLLRNSIEAADYDARAHDSRIPMQRYWQRRRYRHVTELIAGEGSVLDVGCGSSRIIGALPSGSVALDILPNKLRYARRFTRRLVRASGFALPFAAASFPCVLCSQVIEHVPMEAPILDELRRVLAPGGRLVLGTPDYSRWEWVYTEKAYGFFKPNGYADEHIAHYTRAGLIQQFEALGFRHEATRYILRGELILAFRAPKGPAVTGLGDETR